VKRHDSNHNLIDHIQNLNPTENIDMHIKTEKVNNDGKICKIKSKDKGLVKQNFKMDLQPGIFCYLCKNKFKLKERFRLHDSNSPEFNTPRYFYRYESCDKCHKQFKIEYFTSVGISSGARSYNYEGNTLEGFLIKDFYIDEVVEENDKAAKILRIKRKCVTNFEEIYYSFKEDVVVKTEKRIASNVIVQKESIRTLRKNIYTCDSCKMQFESKRLLDVHIKTTHYQNDNQYSYYQCNYKEKVEQDFCDVTLAYEDTQHKNHKQSISLRRNAHIFEDSTTLNERGKSKKCSQVFTVKSELHQHIYLHQSTNEFYDCEQCSKVFSNRSKLKEHLTVHEENYSCEICSIHFKKANYLKTHVKTKHDFHFACEICDLTFSSKSDMKYHAKFHHILFKGQPLENKCCIETFKNEEKLIRIKGKEKNWKKRRKKRVCMNMINYICSTYVVCYT